MRADGRIAKGYINYNATQQALVMPNLITMAARFGRRPSRARADASEQRLLGFRRCS